MSVQWANKVIATDSWGPGHSDQLSYKAPAKLIAVIYGPSHMMLWLPLHLLPSWPNPRASSIYESSLTRWFTLDLPFRSWAFGVKKKEIPAHDHGPRPPTFLIWSPSFLHQSAYWLAISTSICLSPISVGPHFRCLFNGATHLSIFTLDPKILASQSLQRHLSVPMQSIWPTDWLYQVAYSCPLYHQDQIFNTFLTVQSIGLYQQYIPRYTQFS